jgi:hypothetical protein
LGAEEGAAATLRVGAVWTAVFGSGALAVVADGAGLFAAGAL